MKKNMKKSSRLISLLLVFMMVFTMMPGMAWAENENSSNEQVRVIVENTKYSVADGAGWEGLLLDTWVDIDSNSSMMSCLVDALETIGATCQGVENNYVSAIITSDGNEVGAGGSGGWMCNLNDWFINEGLEAFTVADGKLEKGDEIHVFYSLAYGEDYGGTWLNNDKTVSALSFSAGTLDSEFSSSDYEYTLTVPAEITSVVVTPTATNKNFQVRASVEGTEYKRTESIPVENGTVISVKCGDPAWPSMNNGEYGSGAENVEAVVYTVTVAKETPVVEIESVSLDKSEVTLEIGGTETLTATVSPDNATDKIVTWTSSNTAVATVTNGVVTAVSAGEATITAKAGEKTATCAVTVNAAEIATSHTIDVSSYGEPHKWNYVEKINISGVTVKESSCTAGETMEVNIVLDSSTSNNAAFTMEFITAGSRAEKYPMEYDGSTVNTKIVTLDNGGKVFEITTKGAYSSSKSETITWNFTISIDGVQAGFSITPNTAELIGIGNTVTLTPQNASGDITWTSSNESVATVADGVVTSVGLGTAVITVASGGQTAECIVTVVAETILNVGDTVQKPHAIWGYLKNITVKGNLFVKEWSQDDTTVNIVLPKDTAENVAFDLLFAGEAKNLANFDIKYNDASYKTVPLPVQLSGGKASLTLKVIGGNIECNWIINFEVAEGDTITNHRNTISTGAKYIKHNTDVWCSDITVIGPEVESSKVTEYAPETRKIVILLSEDTAQDAEGTLEFKTAAASDVAKTNMEYSVENPYVFKLQDGKTALNLLTKGNTNPAVTRTYEIILKNSNTVPAIIEGVQDINTDWTTQDIYSVKLSDIFTDADGDAIDYSVSVDGAAAEPFISETWSYPAGSTGTHTLTFTACDGIHVSEPYTVTLNVQNSADSYNAEVKVPDAVTPAFYITKDFDTNGNDITGETLSFVKGDSSNGWTSYSVAIPENINRISFRGTTDNGTVNWGGMTIETEKNMAPVVLRQLQAVIEAKVDNGEGTKVAPTPEQAVFRVKYAENSYAVAGNTSNDDYGYLYYRFFLVAADNSLIYTHYAEPLGDLAADWNINEGKTKTVTTDKSSVLVASLPFAVKKACSITVPVDAEVRMFRQSGYFNVSELETYSTVNNGNGTKTVTFNKVGGGTMFRVSKEGEITKAGYISEGNITVNWNNDDRGPDYRRDYAADSQNQSMASRGDDSMYVNVNYRNNLRVGVNETFQLRAYRIWEIINTDVDNIMIEPDFNYEVISGKDVISVTPYDGCSGNATNNWLDIKGLKEGTAVLEISYDAIDVISTSGGTWENGAFAYNASDPARTALVVVQVGNSAADVDFGIKNNNGATWDAEHDTLYFTGEETTLQFKPTVASGSIKEVAVSNNKGDDWTILEAAEGTYTAKIKSGNNIIRVTKADDTVSYQIVRGDEVTYTITEVAGNSDGDGTIEAGEKVRVKINGVHNSIGKMSGIYNPADYRTYYTFNGEQYYGGGGQYTYPQAAYVEVTIPENTAAGAEYILTNGYTTNGGWGSGGGAHRGISGEVPPGLDSEDASGTYNIFPDITIKVGTNADTVAVKSISLDKSTATVEAGKTVTLNATVAPSNATDKTVTWTSSDAAVATVVDGVVTGVAEGTANITATAGGISTFCAVTVLPDGSGSGAGATTPPAGGLDFGLSEDEIVGYVTVSFEDYATRKDNDAFRGEIYKTKFGSIIPATRVPFKAYDTIASVTLRLLDAMGYQEQHTGSAKSGFYLASIKGEGTDNVWLGEFDGGQDSGWMITWDDWFINKGASEFYVEDGNVVRWQYTCQLGRDIGDTSFDREEEEEVKDVTTSGGAAGGATGEPVTTTTPTEVTVSGSTATATITKENVTETIKQATESKSTEIVVQVSSSDTKGAANVKVQLDTTTVKDVVNKTEAALTVKTENATVTLDRETLKTVAAEATGSTVTLEAIEVVKPTEAQREAAGENGHVIQLVIKSGDKIISLFNEGKATVTVEIPAKLDGKKVAAIHIGDDGKIEHLQGQEVTVNGKKHYRFDTPHFSTFALVDADEIGLEVEEQMTADEVKALIADLTPVARSSKTANKNIKVTVKLDKADKAIIEELEAEGFTVKYNFYRSTKKASKYKSMLIKSGKSYTNTKGKKNQMYYYKVRVQVYDADGKLVARTALKDCKYANRKWTK